MGSEMCIRDSSKTKKRNTFGKAMGDVMLPEDGVQEVGVVIHKFWSWFTPGFWALKLEFQSELELIGTLENVPSGTQVMGYAYQKHQSIVQEN